MNFNFKYMNCLKSIVICFVLLLGFSYFQSISAQYISDDGWKEFGNSYWTGDKPVRGGVYKTAFPKYVGLMNPNHWPINDFTTLAHIYERLVYRDGQYRASIPYLAESWNYLDPLTVVTYLRKGVKYHDDSDFNAASVKYQIDWINDKKNGCWDRAYLSLLKSVEIMDSHTLKWHFKKPWAVFSGGVLAGIPGWPISAEALKKDVMLKEMKGLDGKLKTAQKKVSKAEKKARKVAAAGGKKAEKARKKVKSEQKKLAKLEKKLNTLKKQTAGAISTDQHAVGTGMFMVEEGRPGNYTLLKRNPNWWFAKHVGRPEMPYFDKMQVMVIPDPAIQLANLRAGKIHYMGIDKSMYQLIKRDPNMNIHTYPMNSLTGLRFNQAKGPFKDIRVRKAVSHAIDRKAIIAGTQFGMARIASSIYPEDHWCHNPDLKPVSYDPELSKKLLAEAGYPNGLEVKGHMINVQAAVNLATAIRGMLLKAGITWKVDMLEPAAASSRRKNLEYELSGGGYGFIWDPDLVATNLYHPDGFLNFGRSNNEKAIALIKAGRIEVDDQKRQKIYFELEEAIYNNFEDVWIYWPINLVAYHKRVQGYNNDMYIKYREGYGLTHALWFKDGK